MGPPDNGAQLGHHRTDTVRRYLRRDRSDGGGDLPLSAGLDRGASGPCRSSTAQFVARSQRRCFHGGRDGRRNGVVLVGGPLVFALGDGRGVHTASCAAWPVAFRITSYAWVAVAAILGAGWITTLVASIEIRDQIRWNPSANAITAVLLLALGGILTVAFWLLTAVWMSVFQTVTRRVLEAPQRRTDRINAPAKSDATAAALAKMAAGTPRRAPIRAQGTGESGTTTNSP